MKDVHFSERRLNGSLDNLETIPNKKNQEFIKDFVRSCELQEISKGRIGKYVYLLSKISEWSGKDFDKVGKKDIEELVLRINNMSFGEWSKHDYKVGIKKFFRFMGKDELVAWIKTTIKRNKDENLPNEVYTLEEVEKLIKTADNPRDKALISFLYESGCRISELLNIKLKDVKFEEDYALVNVMGKTGNREVPISKSIPLLKTWINYYDSGKDKEAYLFPLGYVGVSKILRKLFKRAEIDKPFNPHQFRHSRATELAKSLTEAQMKQFFGWVQGSNMASVYVHLSGRDLIPKLITDNKKKKCLKCGFENPMDLKFCSNCLMPLDSKEYDKKQKHELLMEDLLSLANNDRTWLEETARKIQSMRLTKHH